MNACEQSSLCLHLHRTKAHLKWTEEKWKTVLCSDKLKCEILFGKHGPLVLLSKEERVHLACY